MAVIDTGVDANTARSGGGSPPGEDVFTNGFGNDDPFADRPATAAAPATRRPDERRRPRDPARGRDRPVRAPGDDPAGEHLRPLHAGVHGRRTGLDSNVLTSNEAVYQGLKYVADNPFVNDPVRPNKTDRVIAAAMGFGTLETFDSEGSAFRQHKQVVIAFKNQLKRFRSLGITPVAAAGQFGAPPDAGADPGEDGGRNNAENPNIGDLNGISLPAILNEVISVTGSLPFPLHRGRRRRCRPIPASGSPRDPFGPVLLFNNTRSAIGGDDATLDNLRHADRPATPVVFSDRILAAANRNITTDFAAPALDIPTFRRKFGRSSGQTAADLGTIDLDSNVVYNAGGHLALGGDRHRVVRPGRLGARLLGRHLRHGRHGRRLPDPAGRGCAR